MCDFAGTILMEPEKSMTHAPHRSTEFAACRLTARAKH
jgi:hypothetical protein